MTVDTDRLLRAASTALAFDAAARAAFEARQTPYHLDAGARAVTAVAAAAALSPADWIFPALHQTGAAIWRGVSLERLAHRALASAEDPSRGRALPGLAWSRQARIAPPTMHLGAHLLQSVGTARAARLRGTSDLVLAFAGGASAATPAAFGALRQARADGLPWILVVDGQPPEDLGAVKVAGDALAVHAGVADAADKARNGTGPMVLQVTTVLDPLAELGELADVGAEVEAAFAAARAAGPPPASAAFEDVLALPSSVLDRQKAWMLGNGHA